jgi:hypothetical protein
MSLEYTYYRVSKNIEIRTKTREYYKYYRVFDKFVVRSHPSYLNSVYIIPVPTNPTAVAKTLISGLIL